MTNQPSFDTALLAKIDNAKVLIQKAKEGDIVLRSSGVKISRLASDGILHRVATFLSSEEFSYDQKMEHLYVLSDAILNYKTIQRGYLQ